MAASVPSEAFPPAAESFRDARASFTASVKVNDIAPFGFCPACQKVWSFCTLRWREEGEREEAVLAKECVLHEKMKGGNEQSNLNKGRPRDDQQNTAT